MFYAPIFPFGLFIEIIGLCIFYWVSKYLLLRRSAFPNSLSNEITSAMMRVGCAGPLVFSTSSIIFDRYFNPNTANYSNYAHYISIAISLMLMIFGNKILSKKIMLRFIKPKDECHKGDAQ
jgi:hypothetical protein